MFVHNDPIINFTFLIRDNFYDGLLAANFDLYHKIFFMAHGIDKKVVKKTIAFLSIKHYHPTASNNPQILELTLGGCCATLSLHRNFVVGFY